MLFYLYLSIGVIMNQFNLLQTKRFLPLFITQFLGAFNDNVFKNALIMLVVFKLVTSDQAGLWTNIAAGLFILPFFLFSSLAGQIAEKYDKSNVIKVTKFAEIIIMAFGSIALYIGSPILLVSILFLMGTQSAFFGPCKYSIIPQHLKEEEFVGANGLMEMGTFLSILVGTMVGAYCIVQANGEFLVSLIVLSVSIFGFISSLSIPKAPSLNPETKINFNIFSETKNLISILKNRPRSVYLSVVGISWFWFLGATYLTQLPSFVKDYLGGNETVVTLILTVFSLGIALGSLLCESLSRRKIELGIVPFGSIGLTLFGVLLYFSVPNSVVAGTLSIPDFLSTFYGYSVIFNLFMIGVFGGFYTVPLYALIQKRTEKEYMSRIIAANNMLNAFFMVINAVIVISLFALGLTIPEILLTMSIFSAIVSIYIYRQVPEFFIRFVIWMLSHTMYRVKHHNIDNLPEEGACIVASNHVSFIDALLLGGAFKRPVRFVMYEPIYKLPILNAFFKAVKAIPIDSKEKNPEVYEAAFKEIKKLLENGEVLCIFPEGKLTNNGEMAAFKNGIEKIVKETPVPVLPCAITGLWGSLFSRKHKIRYPRPKWSKVEIIVGDLVQSDNVKSELLFETITKLKSGKNP